ncbi:MAG: hypothetical protein ABEH35_08590 [Haloarculaceae archaeon]
MSDLESAVEEFLRAADDCYEEYERGYTDADATLRRLEPRIEELRGALEDEDRS